MVITQLKLKYTCLVFSPFLIFDHPSTDPLGCKVGSSTVLERTLWMRQISPLFLINLQLCSASKFTVYGTIYALDIISLFSLLPVKPILSSFRYVFFQLTVDELFVSMGSPESSLFPISCYPMPAFLHATLCGFTSQSFQSHTKASVISTLLHYIRE